MPKISFVIPVYNVEKYLRCCMDSIVQQTLIDIEIICVDDCSTDNSLSILREYEANDSRVKVIHLLKNIKQGGARNRALDIATGEFLSFVDSDDWIDVHLAEDMYRAAKEQNADMVRGVVMNYYSVEKQIPEPNESYRLSLPNEEWRRLCITDSAHVQGGIIKRSIFEKHHIRYPEQIFYEDNAINALIWLYCQKVINLNKTYYYYRFNNQSTTHKINNFRTFDRLETSKMFLENMKSHGFYEKYKEECDYCFLRLFYYNTAWMAIFNFTPPAYDYLARSYREMKQLVPDFRQNHYYKEKLSRSMRFIFFTLIPTNVRAGVYVLISLRFIKHILLK